MKFTNPSKFIPIILILILTSFLGVTNQKENTKLKILIWNTPSLPLGTYIAISTGNSVDTFLMAISIGASCAFLSPIGHQCNTLVMGPGNYKFGDYWKLGLPLEIVIILVSVPCIIYFWS